VALADNAAKTPHRPRYLVVADWAPARDLPVQLAARRLTAAERLRAGHFTVYEITESPQPPASWRVCREGARGEGRGALRSGFVRLAAPAAQLSACPVEDRP
jgi:hypothetical protein